MLGLDEVTSETRQQLQDSLILVHGGMAQNVGPILEMVTEKYLLRSEAEWVARLQAHDILDEIVSLLRRECACPRRRDHAQFLWPIQTIIPRATTLYTEMLIDRVKAKFGAQFWGFWMLGGASGGGMGFIFDPQAFVAMRLKTVLHGIVPIKRQLEHAVPFAMEPVVYDFAINARGTCAELLSGGTALMPPGYYTLTVPRLLRREPHELSTLRQAELNRFGAACRTQPELAAWCRRSLIASCRE